MLRYRVLFAGSTRLVTLLMTLLAAASPVCAQTLLQQREDRLISVLPNRLIVIAQRMPAAPVVSAQVWVKTGSVYEQEHVGAGLSHFLEHLVAGGATERLTEEQSNTLLADIGARTNAATGMDTVHYYIQTTSPYTAQAIDLLSDWLAHARIDDRAYQRERDVIQREFDMGRGDPGRIYWKLTQQARYQHHPARHPTIGYLDEFLAVTREEIIDFYRRMYVPNNMVFVVVGDIDPRAVTDQIAQRWADVEPRELPSLALPREPANTTPVDVTGQADIKRTRLRLAFPGVRMGETHDYALDLLAAVLGSGESSRLPRTLRDERRMVNTIDAYNASFHFAEGFFGVDAEPAEGVTPDAVRTAVLELIAAVRDEPVTQAELDRARRQALVRLAFSRQSAEGVASSLARNLIATGNPDDSERYVDALRSLTPADLQAAARAVLDPQRLITVTLNPGEPTDPARPPLPEGIAPPMEPVDLDNARLVERLAQVPVEAGRQRGLAEPVTLHTLSNGLRVVLGPGSGVEGGNSAASVQFYQLGGLLADEPGREGMANAAASMLERGTTELGALELAEAFENLGASLTTSAGNMTWYARTGGLSEDLPQLITLIAQVVTEPAFDPDEWQRLRPRLLAAIDRQRDTWSGELQDQFRQAYFDSHPWSYAPLGRRATVESAAAQELAAFHHDRLNAASAVLAVFGHFDPQALLPHIEQAFASLPAQPRVPFVAPKAPQPTPGQRVSVTSKPLVAVLIGCGPGPTIMEPDYAVMRVLARVMSRFPSGWLERSLRGEGAGLVYASAAWLQSGIEPGYLGVMFNTSAAQAGEALARATAVLDRAVREPVDEATLRQAIATAMTDEFFARQTVSERAAQSALDVLYGMGLDRDDTLLQEIRSVDASSLRAVAERRLSQRVVTVIAPPGFSLPTD